MLRRLWTDCSAHFARKALPLDAFPLGRHAIGQIERRIKKGAKWRPLDGGDQRCERILASVVARSNGAILDEAVVQRANGGERVLEPLRHVANERDNVVFCPAVLRDHLEQAGRLGHKGEPRARC